jgi:hypothetical protein
VDVVDITSNGGPEVFLLSHSRLANPTLVSAEVARLAKFLEVPNYQQADFAEAIASLQKGAAAGTGDVSLLSAAQTKQVDETRTAPRVDPRVTVLYGTAAASGAFADWKVAVPAAVVVAAAVVGLVGVRRQRARHVLTTNPGTGICQFLLSKG